MFVFPTTVVEPFIQTSPKAEQVSPIAKLVVIDAVHPKKTAPAAEVPLICTVLRDANVEILPPILRKDETDKELPNIPLSVIEVSPPVRVPRLTEHNPVTIPPA